MVIELIYMLIYAAASIFRNNLYLRMFLVFGAIIHLVFLLYFTLNPDSYLIIVVIIFLSINGVHLVYYVNQTLGFNLSQRDLEMKEMIFDFMDKSDFKILINSGKWEKALKGTYIIEENTSLDKLILISKGNVDVYKGDQKIAKLQSGNFAGEMSFMTGNKTNADVIAHDEVEYIYWKKSDILNLMEQSVDIEIGIYAVLNKDLIGKLKI